MGLHHEIKKLFLGSRGLSRGYSPSRCKTYFIIAWGITGVKCGRWILPLYLFTASNLQLTISPWFKKWFVSWQLSNTMCKIAPSMTPSIYLITAWENQWFFPFNNKWCGVFFICFLLSFLAQSTDIKKQSNKLYQV